MKGMCFSIKILLAAVTVSDRRVELQNKYINEETERSLFTGCLSNFDTSPKSVSFFSVSRALRWCLFVFVWEGECGGHKLWNPFTHSSTTKRECPFQLFLIEILTEIVVDSNTVLRNNTMRSHELFTQLPTMVTFYKSLVWYQNQPFDLDTIFQS